MVDEEKFHHKLPVVELNAFPLLLPFLLQKLKQNGEESFLEKSLHYFFILFPLLRLVDVSEVVEVVREEGDGEEHQLLDHFFVLQTVRDERVRRGGKEEGVEHSMK